WRNPAGTWGRCRPNGSPRRSGPPGGAPARRARSRRACPGTRSSARGTARPGGTPSPPCPASGRPRCHPGPRSTSLPPASSARPARQTLAFIDDRVPDLQPATAVVLHPVEVLREGIHEQPATLGIEPEPSLHLVEQLLLDLPGREQVDHDPLGMDPVQFDQII